MKRTLVLGVGSSILTDDAVGLLVVRKLRERFADRDDLDFGENEEAGFSLLEESLGYDRLVVVDAVITGREPGTVRRYDLSDLGRTIHCSSPHGLNLATALELGRRQGMDVPEEVVVLGVEVVDVLTFGEGLSAALSAVLDDVVEKVASEIASRGGSS